MENDQVIIEKTLEALRRNGFKAFYAESKEEAADRVMESINHRDVVGVGGSVTVRELGLIEALSEKGNKVVHHWRRGLTPEERLSILKEEVRSDVFLTSSNAITMDGKLVNRDMTGNRVAAMIFGPERVLVVAGKNKIVKDLEGAYDRIDNVAAPLNAKRIGVKTPCVKTGYCTECDSPERICRVTTVMEKAPHRSDITVILINEEMGY